jgi:hypothetical protein
MTKRKTSRKRTKRVRHKRTIHEEASARTECIARRSHGRRSSKRAKRRCNSLFYARCLTSKGTVSKTKRCRAIAHAPLSKGR